MSSQGVRALAAQINSDPDCDGLQAELYRAVIPRGAGGDYAHGIAEGIRKTFEHIKELAGGYVEPEKPVKSASKKPTPTTPTFSVVEADPDLNPT